ncbi:Uncharacterised protein [Mycobacteroides abscessus subsp. abscessus]|nr:Uncharacterised protein [Mycobacteroides abscessus subsp. abscessus]
MLLTISSVTGSADARPAPALNAMVIPPTAAMVFVSDSLFMFSIASSYRPHQLYVFSRTQGLGCFPGPHLFIRLTLRSVTANPNIGLFPLQELK